MINDAVKETGQRVAKDLQLRGKFSEYVEILIKDDLKKRKITAVTDIELKKQKS